MFELDSKGIARLSERYKRLSADPLRYLYLKFHSFDVMK